MNDPTVNDPSAEPRSIGGSDSTAMPVCPFVGRRNDPALVEAMPDGEHRCYKPPSPHRIRSDIQGRFCLSARYQRCPVYRGVVAHPPGPSLSERIFGGGLLELIRSPMGLAFIFFAMLIPAAIGVWFAVLDDGDEPADAQSAVAEADAEADADADAEPPALPADDPEDDGAQAAAPETPPDEAEQTAAEQSGGGQQATAQAAAEEQSAEEQSAGEQATDAPAAEEQAAEPAQPAPEPDPDLTPRERLFNWTDLVEHVVEAGDSLGAIAAVYGTTVEALAVFNGIADVNSITIGQVIAVPVGFTEDVGFESAAPAAVAVEEAPPAAEDDGADTGDAGETDDTGGADDTGETGDTGETDDTADDTAGETEPEPESDAVPTATDSLLAWTDVVEWLVEPGDTLFLISQEFSTTVDALAALNGIDPAVPILIGQVLRVPRGFLESLQ